MSHEHLNEQPAEPTYTPEEAIAAGYRIMGDKVFERVSVRDCDKEDLVCVGQIGPRKGRRDPSAIEVDGMRVEFQAKELKGLSLRDHFAGEAIPGVMRMQPMPLSHPEHAEYYERIADYTYGIADAMLKRREQ
jgi:hypothetical protein